MDEPVWVVMIMKIKFVWSYANSILLLLLDRFRTLPIGSRFSNTHTVGQVESIQMERN
jgi:hypothetical protein